MLFFLRTFQQPLPSNPSDARRATAGGRKQNKDTDDVDFTIEIHIRTTRER